MGVAGGARGQNFVRFTAVEQIIWPGGLTSSYIIKVVVCLIPKEIVKFIHN